MQRRPSHHTTGDNRTNVLQAAVCWALRQCLHRRGQVLGQAAQQAALIWASGEIHQHQVDACFGRHHARWPDEAAAPGQLHPLAGQYLALQLHGVAVQQRLSLAVAGLGLALNPAPLVWIEKLHHTLKCGRLGAAGAAAWCSASREEEVWV